MTNEAKKRLLDVVSACEAIAEALNKAGSAEPSLATQIPDFHRIIGLRNRLIHGYDRWTMRSSGTSCRASWARCRHK